jgi:hypothetical protein
VPFGDSAVILYQQVPLSPVLGSGPEATPLGLATVSAEGALAGAGHISWVTSAAPAGPLPSACSNSLVVPRLEVQKGTLLLFSTGGAFRVDTALQPSAGPIPLPTPATSKVRWPSGSDHVLAAWTGTAPGVGELPDLLVRRFRDTGVAEAAVQRVSTANDVLGVAEGEGVMAVIFSAEEGEYLALTDSQGAKIGGDVALGGGQASIDGGDQASSGGASSPEPHVLLAAAPRRFVNIHVRGAAIVRQEIACE